jgi:hypothetical protein
MEIYFKLYYEDHILPTVAEHVKVMGEGHPLLIKVIREVTKEMLDGKALAHLKNIKSELAFNICSCTHPPSIHPGLTTTQLRLTPEEAKEVHDKCICAQREIQKEIEEEDWVWHQQKEQGAHSMHPPLPEHIIYNTTNHNDTPIVSSEHHGELNPQQEPD